jgi:pimeloyl-ACP methyl ester carboxylesterase
MNWDFIYRGETKHLDDAARAKASGSFVKLSDGCTHYELGGPHGGEVVVLVHGFSIPYMIWNPTYQALISEGWRVLRYDLFGRGYSDRPQRPFDLSLFVRQLGDLLDALAIPQVDLIGLSMGGAIAAAFTVQHPTRIHKLILIDPIGTQPMPLGPLYSAGLLPGIGELVLGLVGTDKIIKGIASDFYDPKLVEQFVDDYRDQMQFQGFKRAILSTLRSETLNGFPEIYEQLGKLQVPILLIWGRNDQTLPLAQSDSIIRLLPRLEFHVIEGCGHIPHYEKPEIVNPIISRFLSLK